MGVREIWLMGICSIISSPLSLIMSFLTYSAIVIPSTYAELINYKMEPPKYTTLIKDLIRWSYVRYSVQELLFSTRVRCDSIKR